MELVVVLAIVVLGGSAGVIVGILLARRMQPWLDRSDEEDREPGP